MERDVSFSLLIKILKRTWWMILIIALVAMILVATFTELFVPKKYKSSIQFYIINIDANTDYASAGLLSAAAQLANDYADIMSSEYTLTQVQAELEARGYENLSIEKLQSMLQHSAKSSSSVFTVSVVHTNPTVAYDVATVLAELAPEIVTEIAKPENSRTKEGYATNLYNYIDWYNRNIAKQENKPTMDLTKQDILAHLDYANNLMVKRECIRVLTPPTEATTPVSPNVVTITLLGGVLAVAAAYIMFLLKALLEQGITNEDDLKTLVGRPVIGVIPHWDTVVKK